MLDYKTDYRLPKTVRVKKFPRQGWFVFPPKGMWFDKDDTIGRPNRSPFRIFIDFPAAMRYVASGAAQRSVIAEPTITNGETFAIERMERVS